MITVSYWGKNCFGRCCDREDSVEHETEADIRSAFLVLKAAASNSMYTDCRAVYWDSLDDYQKQILTERVFVGVMEYDDRKVSLQDLRKEWINRLNGKEVK